MLWVYGHYSYVYSYGAGIDIRRQNLQTSNVYRRQILTSKVDPRATRVNAGWFFSNFSDRFWYVPIMPWGLLRVDPEIRKRGEVVLELDVRILCD